MNGKITMEEFYNLSKEDLFEKLKETYYKQKLDKKTRLIVCIPGVILGVLWMIIDSEDIIYGLIFSALSLWKAFKPHANDEHYLNKLAKAAEYFEDFKNNRNSVPELKKYDSSVFKRFLKYIEIPISHKIQNYIPIWNLVGGEKELYGKYLNGYLRYFEYLNEVENIGDFEKFEKKRKRSMIMAGLGIAAVVIFALYMQGIL